MKPALFCSLIPARRDRPAESQAWKSVYQFAHDCGFDTLFRYAPNGDGKGWFADQVKAVKEACLEGNDVYGVKSALYFRAGHDAQVTGYTGPSPNKHAWLDFTKPEHVRGSLARITTMAEWPGVSGIFLDYRQQPWTTDQRVIADALREFVKPCRFAGVQLIMATNYYPEGHPDPAQGRQWHLKPSYVYDLETLRIPDRLKIEWASGTRPSMHKAWGRNGLKRPDPVKGRKWAVALHEAISEYPPYMWIPPYWSLAERAAKSVQAMEIGAQPFIHIYDHEVAEASTETIKAFRYLTSYKPSFERQGEVIYWEVGRNQVESRDWLKYIGAMIEVYDRQRVVIA